MKFITIEPAETRVTVVDADQLQDLYALLGFDDNIDHGVIAPPHNMPDRIGIGILVGGFSLFEAPERQRYFAIGRQLFGGNALLYSFNMAGETVDIESRPLVIFMTYAGAEMAIRADQIDRPHCSINGKTYWQWPQPSPHA